MTTSELRSGEMPTEEVVGSSRARRAVSPFAALGFLLFCCVFAITFVGAPSRAIAPRIPGYAHRHWDVEEGSPSDIRAIAQTRDGFLWLGTSNGLYRFDGLSFEKIKPRSFNRWRSNQITALAAAPDGTLWVGYDFGGVAIFRDGQLLDANLDMRPRGAVWSIMVSRDGDVWVSVNGESGSELRRLHRGKWHSYTSRDWLQPEPIQDTYQAHDGTIWIAQFHSILRLPPGAARPEKIPEEVGIGTAFAEDEDGALWLLSDRGMQRLSPPRSLRKVKSDGTSSGSSGKRSLLFEDGLAWLAGHREGVIRLPNLKQLAGGPDVIAVRSRVLYRDREGTIWGGGPDGLVHYIRSPILPANLKGAPTTGFAVGDGADAPIYVATDTGVYRLSDPSPELIRKAPFITALCAGPPNQVLVTSLSRHHLLRDGRWTTIRAPGDVMAATDCAIDQKGQPWALAPGSGLYKFVQNKWELEKNWPSGQTLLGDGKDGFYISEPMHLFLHAHPGSVQTLWKDEEIKVGFIHLIKKVDDNVYLGGEKGLARYDGKRIVALESQYNPWLTGISGLAIGAKDVWLIGSEGIFRVSLADFDQAFDMPARPLAHQLIGGDLGLTSRSFAYVANDAVLDHQGNPWFVTNRGVVRVDQARIHRNMVPPPVSIRSLEANGNVYTQANVTLPAGTTRFQFDYVALSLTNPVANVYRYKLDGIDDGWVNAGGRRQATYTGLRPGHFKFQVIAANSDGVWNREGAATAITILPYFWQTWWFKAAILLIAAVLLWAFVRWRMRVASEAMRERIEDRLAIREHIAQELHDTLLQGFQGLVLRFQSILNRLPMGNPARGELEATLERADDVLQEGRDRVRYLREATEPVELVPMLSRIAKQVLGSQIRWAIKETGTPRPVCAPVAEDISRIANEAMFNALRHAQASAISLRILNGKASVIVCVCDDGVGLDPSIRLAGKRDRHYGLVGMRERAQRLGGTLKINDADPKGTEICLIIPAKIAYR